MYADSHIHTSFSSDSDTAPEAQIDRAIELGLTEMTFTDHYDIDFPPGELDFLFDAPAYYREMLRLRERYSSDIRINIGVELGLQPHLTREVPSFAASLPFDFIIGSTHVTRHIDPYEEEEFIRGLTEEEAYRTYFEEELTNLKMFDCYDVAGHIDYVVRYGPNRNRFYTYDRYGDLIDEILRVLIAKGKGIEFNTAGFKAGLGYGHPMPDALKRYRELGGEIITLGSDAHTPDYLASEFERSAQMLRDAGFRYYCVFHDRKPEFLPL